ALRRNPKGRGFPGDPLCRAAHPGKPPSRPRGASSEVPKITCAPASRRLALWLSALATAGLIALSSATAFAAMDADALAGRPLLAALRAGGLILYFRHTSTDFGQNDEQMTGFEDCARQRNLTDRGRDEARAI